MSVLRALKSMLFGETWLLPAGVACIMAAAVLLRSLLGDGWRDVGGFVLLAGAAVVLVTSVARGARPRR
jgi:hypothetical protein